MHSAGNEIFAPESRESPRQPQVHQLRDRQPVGAEDNRLRR